VLKVIAREISPAFKMFPLHPKKVPSANPPPYSEKEPSPPPPTPPSPAFTPNQDLILRTAPPLDPDWLAHEATLPHNPPNPNVDIKVRQLSYSQSCKDLNAHLLSGLYSDLSDGIKIFDTVIDNRLDRDSLFLLPVRGPQSSRGNKISIRSYNPASSCNPVPLSGRPEGVPDEEREDIVIYYHGGGLYVGDLDSEDLTCRRICKELGCTVYSVDYRLMPEWTADDAVNDALEAFRWITSTRKARRLIVMGSSSGAQLAAMVAAKYRVWRGPYAAAPVKIHGMCLRGPVLCDATDGSANLPPKIREFHTSMSESFHTSLLSSAAVNSGNRTSGKMPLEAETFERLPRHWIQVCTNDVYYSDGVLYGECLREAGVDVRLDVLRGWPHTFWLKAPELERAVQAERDCVEGVRWLLESEVEEDRVELKATAFGFPQPGGFMPLTDEEFERRFNDMHTEDN
jgi:acetyl esterase/lipase